MGRKLMGVEMAPLNVPFQRRLQTLTALFNSFVFFFGGFLTFVGLLFLLHTKFYWVPLIYAAWLWFDRDTCSRGGRPWKALRYSNMYNYLRDFFPISLVKTGELDAKENFIIGYHPHGVMGIGTANFYSETTGFSEKFPGIRPHILTLKLLHYLPIYREYISALGFCDVSKQSIDYIFRKKGNAVVILIGGAKESLDANPKTASIVLKGRMGFVKMALKHGAHLVPSYTFGENDLFHHLLKNKPGSKVRKIQRFFQAYVGYAPIVVSGRGVFNYTFGIVPHRVPVATVVGKPIFVEKDEAPSQDKINALHQRYMQELKDLFDQHKAKHGYEQQSIEFVE